MNYKYDIALSFASEDREYVSNVANYLKELGLKVFYDNYESANLWGKNLYNQLTEIYVKESRFTVIFISRNYARRLWTKHELQAAQARAFQDNIEYLLPARFDDTELPGLTQTIGYIDLTKYTSKEFAEIIALKVSQTLKQDLKIQLENNLTNFLSDSKTQEKIQKKGHLPLVLYSVNTKLAFLISEKYYNQRHYAWCAPYFDISKKANPRSSNPIAIYNEIKNDTLSRDLHSAKISSNRAGLIKGGEINFKKGIIDKNQLSEIISIVNDSQISDFIPLVYVIPTKGIENIIKEAPVSMKAHPFSKEYLIEDLPREKFDIINIDDEYFTEL